MLLNLYRSGALVGDKKNEIKIIGFQLVEKLNNNCDAWKDKIIMPNDTKYTKDEIRYNSKLEHRRIVRSTSLQNSIKPVLKYLDEYHFTSNDLLEDKTPQLGGNLDINGFNITSARSNEDIVLVPSGTGGVLASGIRLAGTQISSDDSSSITITEALQINGATNISGATTLAAMTATTGSYSSTLGVSGVTTLTTTNIDNLTIQDANISSASNSDINITPGGTGDVVLSALRVNGTTLNSSDSTKVTIAEALDVTGATALAALSATTGTFSSTLGVSGATTLTTTTIDNLTLQDANISSASNADIYITPGGTGNIVAGAVTINGTTLSAADSSKITVAEALDVTGALTASGLAYPTSDGSSGEFLKTNGSGTLSFASGGTTLSGTTNNTVTTVTGANAVQGEANLTFDGSTLAVTGAATISTTLADQ